jgi:putative ABC transport system ATP-binding protein
MLQTKDLSFQYNKANPLQFPNIACERGEKWLILGQSGCGKTTLLHLLGGLLAPKSGSVFVNETELNRLPPSVADRFRGKNIGIVFQKSHFVQSLTVEENLLLAQQLAGEMPNKKTVKTILEKLNLGHKRHAKPSALSQGEQQRVAIARALVNSPSVILADEPTSALDDHNTAEVIKLLEMQANEANATLIIVTHDGRLKDYFKNQILL